MKHEVILSLRARRKQNASGGFSLVELIIVIAIIAILAAALAPSLIKYIEKSKLARANKNAKAVYQWAFDYCEECSERGVTINLMGPRAQPMTAYDGTEILYDGSQNDLFMYLRKCIDSKETNKSKAQYIVVYFSVTEAGTISSATWAANKSDNLVGSSPSPAVGKSTVKYGSYYYKPNLGDQ